MNRDDVLRVAKECGINCGKFLYGGGVTEELEDFAAAMYAAGAEAMRERAEVACNPSRYPNVCDRNIAYKCGDAIRALPITPTNTEGEQG